MPPEMASMRYFDTKYENNHNAAGKQMRHGENRPLMDTSGDDSDGLTDRDSARAARGYESGRNGHANETKAWAQLRWNAAPLLMLAGAIAVACDSVFTAIVAFTALSQEDFQTFSSLAWQSWFPSFTAFLIVFGLLAICSLAVAVLAAWLGFKGPKRFMRTFALSVAALGLLILCLGLLVWVYREHARPYVIQAANLMCQDVKTFGCQDLPSSTLSPIELGPTIPPIEGLPEPEGVVAPGPEGMDSLPVLSRRLGTADAVVGYQYSLGADSQQLGNVQFCDKLRRLCVAPPAFDRDTACVCSGEAQPSGSTVPGHWNSSSGAFCEDWESDGSQWCFVSAEQHCHKKQQVVVGTDEVRGLTLVKSDGPCTKEVESRSQLVLDGYHAMSLSIQGVMGMGILFVLLACCSGLVYCLPALRAGGDLQQHEYYGRGAVGGENEQLGQRFYEAQQYAMEVLTEDTPEEIKTALYAHYNQAQKGDVHGARPGFFNFAERSRYDAWERLRGMPKKEAIEGYINAVMILDKA